MRAFLIILLFLAAALVAGAALAYPLQMALLPYADVSLYRMMTRTGMLIALLGFYPLLRYLQVDSLKALGLFSPAKLFFKNIVIGLIIGIGIMLPLVITLYFLSILIPETLKPISAATILAITLKALLAGMFISLVEEGFFRGAMFSAIARNSHAIFAIVLSSALYAALHFINTDTRFPAGQAEGWLDGFTVLAESLQLLANPAAITDSLLALFLAGVLLAVVRRQSGNIAQCIGIHTGWIVIIKLTRYLTDTDHTAYYSYLVGNYNGIIGYLAAFWLALVSLLYLLWHSRIR